jgi:DNA-binding PadR family transcriptional regulator
VGDMTGNGKPRLSVFKGREARLNRIILLILGRECCLNIWQVYKRVRETRGFRHTRYHVINRRIRDLEQEGFIEVTMVKETPQDKKVKFYQPTTKTHLAFLLDAINLDQLIQSANNTDTITLLAALSAIDMS